MNIRRFMRLLIALFVSYLLTNAASADIVSCQKNGELLFTDNAAQCESDVEQVEFDESEVLRVNYRYPERQYKAHSGGYGIYTEFVESSDDESLMLQAVNKLRSTLDKVFGLLPSHTHRYLMDVDFYIMLGPRSRLGGERSGARYFSPSGDTGLRYGDTRWTHAVVIYSVDNFLALSDLWTDKVAVHELAHAWHYFDWEANYPILNKVWLRSRQKSLYLSQKDIHGNILTPAYATTNEKEYFAELSAIYFVGGNYYPFSGADLLDYDRDGFLMIEKVWGL